LESVEGIVEVLEVIFKLCRKTSGVVE
jgi:hypothetical protein